MMLSFHVTRGYPPNQATCRGHCHTPSGVETCWLITRPVTPLDSRLWSMFLHTWSAALRCTTVDPPSGLSGSVNGESWQQKQGNIGRYANKSQPELFMWDSLLYRLLTISSNNIGVRRAIRTPWPRGRNSMAPPSTSMKGASSFLGICWNLQPLQHLLMFFQNVFLNWFVCIAP